MSGLGSGTWSRWHTKPVIGNVAEKKKLKGVNMGTIQKELHTIIDDRLFGPNPWSDSREINLALSKKLNRMGLTEQVAGAPSGTTSATALGNRHSINLIMVFIGLWEIDEMPMILESYGVIDEHECTEIYDQFEALEDIKPTLVTIARKSYFELYRSSQVLN